MNFRKKLLKNRDNQFEISVKMSLLDQLTTQLTGFKAIKEDGAWIWKTQPFLLELAVLIWSVLLHFLGIKTAFKSIDKKTKSCQKNNETLSLKIPGNYYFLDLNTF